MSALRRIAAVAWLEALHLLRDRPSLSLLIVVPAAQVLLFGFAINLEPGSAPVALAGPRAPAAAEALKGEREVRIVSVDPRTGAAEQAVRAGRALIGIDLPEPPPPEAYAPPDPVRVVLDGADPSAAGPALAALQARALRSLGTPAPRVELVRLFNPERRSAWVLAPGLIGVVLMISMLMLGAQTLVREREAGTWESLLATPVTGAEAFAGKLLPYTAAALVQAALVLAVARLAFDLPLAGAWTALLAATPLFALAHLALGFAISGLVATRLQAIQLAVFFYLPSILLSGFMFPFRGMPGWAKAVGEALPLTHWVRSARGVLLRGGDAGLVWREMVPVALWTAAAVVLAVAAYRRRLT